MIYEESKGTIVSTCVCVCLQTDNDLLQFIILNCVHVTFSYLHCKRKGPCKTY